jgi:sulfonate transport system substrate-binding protein
VNSQATGKFSIKMDAFKKEFPVKIVKQTLAGAALLGLALLGVTLASGSLSSVARAADLPKTIVLDYAYYNPVALLLKDKGWVEQEFAKDGVAVKWVFSAGSNKALEFLNADGINFGSSAGAAALLSKINGNPIRSVYIYSKPEWTALVTRKDSPIKKVEDLKGKSVAVTRGTDPYIFLLRTLAKHGLSEKDIKPVLLQHADGRAALDSGQVDAWAGLDPMMAQTELESGSRLFYRDADANTYGFLNVREDFAAKYPKAIDRVLAVYEKGRKYAIANPDELRKILAAAAKLSDTVAAKQLERTDLSNPVIGKIHLDAITAAGVALQQAGVIEAQVNVAKVSADLIEPSFSKLVAQNIRGK